MRAKAARRDADESGGGGKTMVAVVAGVADEYGDGGRRMRH